MSNENEYSISTMTSRFLFKLRVSRIESLKFESNQYQIAWYLNRIAQCLNRIFVAIQIVIESNRDLISPITGSIASLCLRVTCSALSAASLSLIVVGWLFDSTDAVHVLGLHWWSSFSFSLCLCLAQLETKRTRLRRRLRPNYSRPRPT